MAGRTNAGLNATTVTYLNVVGGDTANATQAVEMQMLPDSGIIYDLRVTLTATSDNGGGADTYTFVVMSETSTTSLTCPIVDSTTCTDLVHVAAVTAGSRLSVRSTPANTPASVSARFTFKFISDTKGNTVLMGGGENATVDTVNTTYQALHVVRAGGTTEFVEELLIPTAGTVKSLYVMTSVAPDIGVGVQEYVFTVRKNETGTALTTTISETETADSDTSNSFTVAAGDSISLEIDPSVIAPTAAAVWAGVVFAPDIDGEFILSGSSADTLNGAATEYGRVTTAGNTYSATETDQQQSTSAMIVKAIYAETSADSNNGAADEGYTFTLRATAAATAATCPIPEGATLTCNLTGLAVVLTNAQAIDTAVTPSANDPLSTITANVSYLGYIAPSSDIMEY